jgi:hypothetical protein
VTVLVTVLGVALILVGAAGALNVRRSRDQIVRINEARPPGDRSRSVAGVTAWCAVCVLVGAGLIAYGLG